MTEQIAQFMSALQAASWTYGLIGVFGLVLASVGLAGVTAYAVAQRGHEIGIRMALGAQKRNVLGLVMAEGAALVTVGTITGLALRGREFVRSPDYSSRLRACKAPIRCCWWERRCCLPAWPWRRATCRRGNRCVSIRQ